MILSNAFPTFIMAIMWYVVNYTDFFLFFFFAVKLYNLAINPIFTALQIVCLLVLSEICMWISHYDFRFIKFSIWFIYFKTMLGIFSIMKFFSLVIWTLLKSLFDINTAIPDDLNLEYIVFPFLFSLSYILVLDMPLHIDIHISSFPYFYFSSNFSSNESIPWSSNPD